MLAKAWKHCVDFHQIFVDFKQASDCINRENIYTIFHQFSISNKLIKFIQITIDHTQTLVRIQNQPIELYELLKGLKQRVGLTPVLFHIFVEYIIKKMSSNANNSLHNKSSRIVAFSDNVNVMWWSVRDIKVLYLKQEVNA